MALIGMWEKRAEKIFKSGRNVQQLCNTSVFFKNILIRVTLSLREICNLLMYPINACTIF